MWWLRIVSLSVVITWISVLWIVVWSILIVIMSWSSIVWSVSRIIAWSIVAIFMISIKWIVSIPIVGTISISIIWRVSGSIFWIISISRTWMRTGNKQKVDLSLILNSYFDTGYFDNLIDYIFFFVRIFVNFFGLVIVFDSSNYKVIVV